MGLFLWIKLDISPLFIIVISHFYSFVSYMFFSEIYSLFMKNKQYLKHLIMQFLINQPFCII